MSERAEYDKLRQALPARPHKKTLSGRDDLTGLRLGSREEEPDQGQSLRRIASGSLNLCDTWQRIMPPPALLSP
jgi:hypothetical protein